MRRAIGAALLLVAAWPGSAAAQDRAYEQLQAFSGVLNHVRLNHVDTVGYGTLVRASIDGLLSALDPHSYVVTRAEWQRLNQLEQGELAETGMRLGQAGPQVVVLGVVEDSPADRAGVLPGDRVLAIDDTTVVGEGVPDVALRLAGEKGKRVRVTLERGPVLAPDSVSVSMKRELARAGPGITGRMLPDGRTALVRIPEFTVGTAEGLRRELDRQRKAGAMRVILDLRGNPGGLVAQAEAVAALFLPANTVVFYTLGRKRAMNDTVRTTEGGRFRDVPLQVLVDASSASASEALAGSLQDHDRALIVGRRTFGKALVQGPFFVEPSGDVLWLTIARVYTPSGRLIQREYHGLSGAQYRSLAGTAGAGADTVVEYRTDHGRLVRGGGGIAPDIEVPSLADVPAWWSDAIEHGDVLAVADSAGRSLPPGPEAAAAWAADPSAWTPLVAPLLERVARRVGPLRPPGEPVQRRVAYALARRAAAVRWPDEGGAAAFDAVADPDVQAAMAAWPEHARRLAQGP